MLDETPDDLLVGESHWRSFGDLVRLVHVVGGFSDRFDHERRESSGKTLDSLTTGAIGGSGSASTSTTGTTGTTTKSTGNIGSQTSALQATITNIDSQITQTSKQNNAQLQLLVQEYTSVINTSNAASISQAYLSIFTNTSTTSSSG